MTKEQQATFWFWYLRFALPGVIVAFVILPWVVRYQKMKRSGVPAPPTHEQVVLKLSADLKAFRI